VSLAPRERVLVALDTDRRDEALGLVATLRGRVGGFKIGLELFSACGPEIVRAVRSVGHEVFVDLKLHDIPHTVAGAAAALGRIGAGLLTVHASGGPAMIEAAVEGATRGAAEAGHPRPIVLAVTLLTSLAERDLASVGLTGPCAAVVERLARLAQDAGAGGVVCSPLEVADVRRGFAGGVIVVPGIRPTGSTADDQARVATPRAAVAAGADRLVIGRPITRAANPAAAADAIVAEIDASA